MMIRTLILEALLDKPRILWLNAFIILIVPVFAAILIPVYGWVFGYDLFEWFIFGLFMILTGLSITAGYHRLWSHRAYEAHILVRILFAFFGACGLQNSILRWSSDHRRHHKNVDSLAKDPYSIKRGFWFAHIGWIIRDYSQEVQDFSNVKDLQKDPIVRWQHRHYLLLAVLSNTALLIGIGWLHGRLWGVFLLAGLLRIVLNHHFTFFINSLAHCLGKQPYSDENSSRDNLLLAFLTYGEGYHNYHHRFQFDYRNGIKWFHFDPSKWVIRFLSWIGMAKKLRRPPRLQIEKAKLKMQFKHAKKRLEGSLERQEQKPFSLRWEDKLEEGYHQLQETLEEWARFRQTWVQTKKQRLMESWEQAAIKQKYNEAKINLRLQRQRWRLLRLQVASL